MHAYRTLGLSFGEALLEAKVRDAIAPTWTADELFLRFARRFAFFDRLDRVALRYPIIYCDGKVVWEATPPYTQNGVRMHLSIATALYFCVQL